MGTQDLNLRLGLVTRNFEKSLDRATRKLRRVARDMEDIGRSISEVVSFPVTAAGTAALKSAADFERFEKGLIAVSGSAQEAENQLARLQKIAEAPGIGFEQAVQASLQLQGLGVDAARAEEAIRQVANIVAASGGGSQAFAGAIRQINQIQAKNRVLQEDINILLENAPTLGAVLQETFGAKTAEGIRNLGVDGEEFFDRLVEGLGKVERVQGGLFNTFENFGIAVRKALADLGQEIDRAVGIQDVVNRLTRSVQQVVRVFENLDSETKRSLLSLAAFAAAIGPVVFVGSRIINVYRGVFAVFGTVATASARLAAFIQVQTTATAANAAATGAASRATKGLTTAFRALGAAQKATIIGLAVGAVAFLVTKFQEYRAAINEAADARNALAQTEREAIRSADQEIAKVDSVIKKYNQINTTQEERNALLGQLQSQYPKYFGNLDSETVKIDDLKAARDRLRKSIIEVARARAAEARITGVQDKIIDIQLRQRKVAEDLRKEQLRVSGTTETLNETLFASARAQDRVTRGGEFAARRANALEKEYKNLAGQITELLGVQEQLSGLANFGADSPAAPATPTVPTTPTSSSTSGQRVNPGAAAAAGYSLAAATATEATSAVSRYVAAAEEANRVSVAASSEGLRLLVSGLQRIDPETEVANNALAALRADLQRIQTAASAVGEDSSLTDRLAILKDQIQTARSAVITAAESFGLQSEAVRVLRAELEALQGQYKQTQEAQAATQTNTEALRDRLVEVGNSIREGLNKAFESFFTTLIEGGRDAFGSFLSTLKQVVKQIISQLLAAIATATVLAALFSVIGVGGGFGSVFRNVLGGGNPLSFLQGTPGLAQGGIVPDGFPNDTYLARLSSGEAVIPLDRLGSMLRDNQQPLVAETVIRGSDIVLSYDRASKNIAR